MSWIKRNLFFVLGGVLALGLLGAASFYIYQSWSHNTEAKQKLNEIYGTLQALAQKKLTPGNEEINNIAIAADQERQVREWITQARKHFLPVPEIATNITTSEVFVGVLQRTIDQLQHEASDAGVMLPPKYYFSFTAQKSNFDLDKNSLGALATKLSEVKTIVEILFAAHINALDGLQRVRVAVSDNGGSSSDYTDQHPVANELAEIIPYTVTFRCFSPELARVITSFSTSSNGFVIKSINIQPAGASVAVMPNVAPVPAPAAGPEGAPAAVPAAQPVAARGGLPVVLKEQLLRVTLEVKLVKLLPKS